MDKTELLNMLERLDDMSCSIYNLRENVVRILANNNWIDWRDMAQRNKLRAIKLFYDSNREYGLMFAKDVVETYLAIN